MIYGVALIFLVTMGWPMAAVVAWLIERSRA